MFNVSILFCRIPNFPYFCNVKQTNKIRNDSAAEHHNAVQDCRLFGSAPL